MREGNNMNCRALLREFCRWRYYPESHPPDRPPLIVNEKDGSILVWIPPGEFEMGDGKDRTCPKHQVFLDGYYLGVHCITNRQYQHFVKDTGHRPPDTSDLSGDRPVWRRRSYPAAYAEHPVVCVSWDDASAYCAWAGLTLPTEAQWERGARGPENLCYPWGNDWDAGKCQNDGKWGKKTLIQTCPVWAYPQGVSGFGTLNQSGNAKEWCRDEHDIDFYLNSPARNPENSPIGPDRVLRGGRWSGSSAEGFRAAERFGGPRAYRTAFGGFGFRPCLLPGL